MMPFARHALSLALVSALAGGIAGCAAKKTETEQANSAYARSMSVTQLVQRPLSGSLQASGLLVAFDEAAVSSELSGYRVAQVLVDEGDVVRAGQPLARLDPTLLRPKLEQARAQAAQAQAQAAQARSEAERVRGLDGSGLLADEQIAGRRFQARSAQASVDVARAQLADVLTQQRQLILRAPVSGVVLQRNVRPGMIAASGGDPMFRIARDRRVELDAEVPEGALARLRPGMQANVSLPSGARMAGTVRFISPRVDAETKLGRARITLPFHPQLRPGGFARAEFVVAAEAVPAAPEAAVQFEASGAQLVVIDAQNRAHRVTVRTGARAAGWVQIIQGPPVGTRIALAGGAFLLDGDTVRPVAARLGGQAR